MPAATVSTTLDDPGRHPADPGEIVSAGNEPGTTRTRPAVKTPGTAPAAETADTSVVTEEPNETARASAAGSADTEAAIGQTTPLHTEDPPIETPAWPGVAPAEAVQSAADARTVVFPAPVVGPPPIFPPGFLPFPAEAEAIGSPAALAPPPKRRHRKRRRIAVLFILLLAVLVLVIGQYMRTNDSAGTPSATPVASALPAAVPGGVGQPSALATTAPSKAAAGVPPDAVDKAPARPPISTTNNAFTFASGYGPVLGTTGTLRRFKVAVEKDLGQGNGADFAGQLDRVLGDPRSWIAGRQFRLQRVPQAGGSEFTIYLASAATSEKMCAAGDLETKGYTSCRLPGQVVINQDRWDDAVPGYNAPLEVYRAYAVNHEVGHQLGHGHEACPGKGEPAPVMMQQTYGLKGCVANSWPYLSGKRYAGNPTD
jgi:hypothetical protein